MATIQPTTAPQTVMPMPSATLSLTDWHTWIGILTSAAAVVSVVFHTDLSAYVPLAAIVAATIVLATLMIVKHKYAAALATAVNGLAQGATVAPSNLATQIKEAMSIAEAVSSIQTTLAASIPVTQAPSTSVAQTVAS